MFTGWRLGMNKVAITCVCLVVAVHSTVGAQSSSGGAQTAKAPANVQVTSGPPPSVYRAPALAPISNPEVANAGVHSRRSAVTPTSPIAAGRHLVVEATAVVGSQRSAGGAPTAKTTGNVSMIIDGQSSVHRAPAVTPTSVPQVSGASGRTKRSTVVPTSTIRVDQQKAVPNAPRPSI